MRHPHRTRSRTQEGCCTRRSSPSQRFCYSRPPRLPSCAPRDTCELAFYRGSVMQASVARDDQGGTTYGMVAINPKHVGKYFTHATLGCLARQIAAQSQELLEIVDFNIECEQYVCSGTTTNLYVLGKLIDHLAETPNVSVGSAISAELATVIETLLAEVKMLPRPIQLQRGKATVTASG
ncbi:hypothetical protein BJX70DRAFT_382030 [Aspergillus crustosus]